MVFKNPILAGEELIRSGIRSENYVQGVSGWRIAREGDAEFNDIIVRGDITVTGADPDEYIRIYQFNDDYPILEWSNSSGTTWEARVVDSTDDWLQIVDQGGGGLVVVNGQGIELHHPLSTRGVLFDYDNGFLHCGTIDPWTPETWHALPLQNSWVADVETPQYKMMVDGTVCLRGNAKDGTTVAGTVIGALPAGYRPLQDLRVITSERVTGTDYRRLRIMSNGNIAVSNCTTASLSLDGVRFSLD